MERNENQQERIDAYLRNEMRDKERVAFEQEVREDADLAASLRFSKMVVKALGERHHKEQMMKAWDEEIAMEKKSQPSKKRSLKDDRWVIVRRSLWAGAGVAASAAAVFLLVNWPFYPGNLSCGVKSIAPTGEYRGSSNAQEQIRELMAHGRYDEALSKIETLEKSYEKQLLQSEVQPVDSIRGVNEEVAYDQQVAELALYELTWLKIVVLVERKEKDKAVELLNLYKEKEGCHQEEARILWKKLTE